jgi:hypothetical protein
MCPDGRALLVVFLFQQQLFLVDWTGFKNLPSLKIKRKAGMTITKNT